MVVVSGLWENKLLNRNIIYPNPTTGKFSINFEELTGPCELEIYNQTGQLVKILRCNSKPRFDIEIDIPQGLYFVILKNKKGFLAREKVVVL
jgi:hypothetical protein